jgi:hypothetical protein
LADVDDLLPGAGPADRCDTEVAGRDASTGFDLAAMMPLKLG